MPFVVFDGYMSENIKPKHTHLLFGAHQLPATARMQLSFLCPLWDDITLGIRNNVAYSVQCQNLIYVNIIVVRLTMNIGFNGVQIYSIFGAK